MTLAIAISLVVGVLAGWLIAALASASGQASRDEDYREELERQARRIEEATKQLREARAENVALKEQLDHVREEVAS